MSFQIPQQLSCPICMSILKIPITTQCGHSYCRSCLINASKLKKVCPMCRTEFQKYSFILQYKQQNSSPQKLKQDDNLSLILEDLRNYYQMIKQKNEKNNFHNNNLNNMKINNDHNINNTTKYSYENKSQIMLLLDVKTQQLLLPYNKISVSFQLQNPTLLNRLQKFVARQQSPFNSKIYIILLQNKQIEYGVISRIVSLNKLRYNVYQCILQGKSFCIIQQDSIQHGTSEMQQQFSYRSCKIKQLTQSTNLSPYHFTQFISIFKQIKDHDILLFIYRQIDHKVFQLSNDPIAMFYSVIGILEIQNKQKYQIITSFDDEIRIKAIKNVVEKIQKSQKDVSFNVNGFLNVSNTKGNIVNMIIIFIAVFIIFYCINDVRNMNQEF